MIETRALDEFELADRGAGEDGRLVGFGLTLRPTPHRSIFEDRTIYGFCASDALGSPVLLARSGVIESSCPGWVGPPEGRSTMNVMARIEILQVPECLLVGLVRDTVRRALEQCRVRAEVEERVGDYPSPTLLVDGRDVTGRELSDCSACRLDLPTEEQVLAALCRAEPGRQRGGLELVNVVAICSPTTCEPPP